ncbi:MAG TPA: TRAP transporter permease [Candidatus Methylomirabilis sp.]|nr:TRAP transporter permease [Candidatus Methylomirabilis sp.]
MRGLTGWIGICLRWLAIAMSVYHLYVGATGPPEALVFRGIHLAFATTLILLWYPVGARSPQARPAILDWACVLLCLISIGYLFLRYDYVMTRMSYVTPLERWDLILGIVLTIMVLEATRRTIGPALPITALVFLAYALLGPYLPPLLRHRGFSLELIIDQLYLTTDGIFGIPLAVSATYVILFVLFGAFLEKSGTGQLFMDFASALAGHSPGGPGKISCISSGLFGTISGSAVANVMVDGWLTIPLMKRTGFRPHFAAAVEAVASTGGQIMPPVMGAAAFVMAEFLGVPYITIAKHAAIPALLYYLALFFAIHFEAQRTGLRGLPREELPSIRSVLIDRGHLFVPLLIIVYLMLMGYTAPLAALWGTLAAALSTWMGRLGWLYLVALLIEYILPGNVMEVLGIGWLVLVAIRLMSAEGRAGLKPLLTKLFPDALEDGARNALAVASACACAGIVIGVIALTGAGLQFTSLVLAAAAESLVPALVLTMIAGIILGMGMPTTAAYIVQAALLIPALIKLGILPIAAHMFVFYFAIISAITPPVAMAVYAAAGIGKTNLWATGLAAMRLGATGFIVPFMFVYGPSLLFVGTWFDIVTTIVSACIGVVCLSAALHGWLTKPTVWWERVLLGVAAFCLIKPGIYTDILGLALLGAVLASQRWLDILRPAIQAKGMAEARGPAVELDAAKIERAKQEG